MRFLCRVGFIIPINARSDSGIYDEKKPGVVNYLSGGDALGVAERFLSIRA